MLAVEHTGASSDTAHPLAGDVADAANGATRNAPDHSHRRDEQRMLRLGTLSAWKKPRRFNRAFLARSVVLMGCHNSNICTVEQVSPPSF